MKQFPLEKIIATLALTSMCALPVSAQEYNGNSSISTGREDGWNRVEQDNYQFMYRTDDTGTQIIYDFNNDGEIDLKQSYERQMPGEFVHTMIDHQLRTNGAYDNSYTRQTQQPIPAIQDKVDGTVLSEEPFPNVYRHTQNE